MTHIPLRPDLGVLQIDEASSGVTYTSISSDYEEPSDVGSPGVVIYRYDGLPMHPANPPSPNYVPGPEELEQAPLWPDYVSGPEFPEYLAPSDEEVPVEDQPYVVADSPIALFPGYITDSDPEEDLEDESEDGSTDYTADRGDLRADSTAASLVVDLVPSAEETEPFETDESAATPPPPPAYRTTARMSIRAQTHIQFPSEEEVDKLLAIPTPSPSPLTLLSSPLPLIPSPPFPVPSPPTTSPTYTEAPLGYKASGIQLRTASPPPLPLSSPLPVPPPIILPRTRASMVLMRAAAPSTYILAPRSRTPPSGTPPILPIPLPTSLLPLPLPSIDRRADVLEAVLPPRKRLCIALSPRFEVGESSSATARSTRGFRAYYGFVGTLDAKIRRDPDGEVGYGITNIWVDPVEDAEEIPPTTLVELSQRSDRSLMTGQLNVLRRDRRYHANTALLVEKEARVAREAWAQSMDASHRARVADALAEHAIQRNNNLNGDGSQGSGSGIARRVRPTHECTYTEFLKCQPMKFKGTEGVVGLTQWFERLKTVFNISNCAVENQVKFATCTLHGVALTWWKSHVKTVGHDATYGVPWNTLMKMMTAKYYPRNEIKKLEMEIWELKSDKIEKYVGGLPDMIHGSVMASKPKTMQDVIEFSIELMDKKIRTFQMKFTHNL
ncbi:putative reverse transcriptase domain-containing protein [Tanacetum coccineum]